MDGYTLTIISILILAIQALVAHSIFTLYVNEGQLRETISRQGAELIRLRERLETLDEKTPESANAEDEADEILSPLDRDETLEELIARYERDEEESWRQLNQPMPDASTARMRVN